MRMGLVPTLRECISCIDGSRESGSYSGGKPTTTDYGPSTMQQKYATYDEINRPEGGTKGCLDDASPSNSSLVIFLRFYLLRALHSSSRDTGAARGSWPLASRPGQGGNEVTKGMGSKRQAVFVVND